MRKPATNEAILRGVINQQDKLIATLKEDIAAKQELIDLLEAKNATLEGLHETESKLIEKYKLLPHIRKANAN